MYVGKHGGHSLTHSSFCLSSLQDEMIARLEKLADEGTNFPNASFNPVVNIKFQTGHAESASSPNSIAIYFTGKHNKYRYYVTTDKEGQLVPLKKELPLPPDDWTNHLEFSNSFFTPSGQNAPVYCITKNSHNKKPSRISRILEFRERFFHEI